VHYKLDLARITGITVTGGSTGTITVVATPPGYVVAELPAIVIPYEVVDDDDCEGHPMSIVNNLEHHTGENSMTARTIPIVEKTPPATVKIHKGTLILHGQRSKRAIARTSITAIEIWRPGPGNSLQEGCVVASIGGIGPSSTPFEIVMTEADAESVFAWFCEGAENGHREVLGSGR